MHVARDTAVPGGVRGSAVRRSAWCVVAVFGIVVAGCNGGGGGGGALATFDPSAGDPEAGGTSAPLPGVSEPGQPCPRVAMLTPEGVQLIYPVWLDHHPTRKTELLEELRTVVPEADPRLSADVQGVPAGTTVIVLDPGAYYAPYSPTLLASGEWRAPSTIYVCWRPTAQGPLVPALPHELRHMLTGDPNAGH